MGKGERNGSKHGDALECISLGGARLIAGAMDRGCGDNHFQAGSLEISGVDLATSQHSSEALTHSHSWERTVPHGSWPLRPIRERERKWGENGVFVGGSELVRAPSGGNTSPSTVQRV